MQHRQSQTGFTLVEMLVSLALFTIVATMAVGTLLVLIGGNGRVVSEQTVLTSLSFALDSMTREIRTGSEYFCGNVAAVTAAAVIASTTDVQNCPTDGAVGISFREAGNSITSGGSSARRIAYYFANGTLWRKVGNQDPERLVGDDVDISDGRFVIAGTTPLDGGNDIRQPSVSVIIEALATGIDATDRRFVLQTTVTQRALDI